MASISVKELKSFSLYMWELIDQFSYEDFSPENSHAIHSKFKEKFYTDTPYWMSYMENQTSFSINFKKYGQNRRRISLKFTFEARELTLDIKDQDKLKHEDLRGADKSETISYSQIWKDHNDLFKVLLNIMMLGLTLAAEAM